MLIFSYTGPVGLFIVYNKKKDYLRVLFFVSQENFWMLIKQLKAIIQPEVEDLGFILWGLEIDGANGDTMTVRVFIDYEKGISVDDCQDVSLAISAVLDVEDFINHTFVLEVSSPGVNRRVFNEIQARSLIGFIVKTQLAQAYEHNRRKFTGMIKKVIDNCVTITTDDADISFDFDNVDKMRVVPKF